MFEFLIFIFAFVIVSTIANKDSAKHTWVAGLNTDLASAASSFVIVGDTDSSAWAVGHKLAAAISKSFADSALGQHS